MREAYALIAEAFEQGRGQLVEIDILPTDFPLDSHSASPVLQEGRSIGIRKDGLIRAVPEARQHLLSRNQHAPGRCSSCAQLNLLKPSLILLLFDPEHLTAANARKRHLLARSSGLDYEPDALREDVSAELTLLESLCTSPLHRHSKSITLFSHRRWVVRTFHRLMYEEPVGEGAADAACNTNPSRTWQTFCQRELDMVLRAGARHPKNYVAFSYLRWLLRFVLTSMKLTLVATSGKGRTIDSLDRALHGNALVLETRESGRRCRSVTTAGLETENTSLYRKGLSR